MNPMLLKQTIAMNMSASENGKFPVLKVPAGFNVEILGARWGNKADIAADATNFLTLNLKNGTKTVASGDTKAAYTAPEMVELAITAANKYLSAGETLHLAPAVGGSGKALAGFMLEVDYQFIRVPA
jgi:hypothetical protein